MDNETIIRMAREAGIGEVGQNHPKLHAFATIVAAHEKKFWMEQIEVECNEAVLAEREACAKVCEERADSYKYATDPWAHEHISEANTCAAAIRARSENAGT